MIESLYHLKDEDILNMTIRVFNRKVKNIEHVARLYNPYIGGGDEKDHQKRTATDDALAHIRKRTIANNKDNK